MEIINFIHTTLAAVIMITHRHFPFIFLMLICCCNQAIFAQKEGSFLLSRTLDMKSSLGKEVQSIKAYCARTVFHKGLISVRVVNPSREDRTADEFWRVDPFSGTLKEITFRYDDSLFQSFYFKDGRPIMCVVGQVIDAQCYSITRYLANFFYADNQLIHAVYREGSNYKDTVLADRALEVQRWKPIEPIPKVGVPYSKSFLTELKNWNRPYELKEDYMISEGDTIMFPTYFQRFDCYEYRNEYLIYSLCLQSINFTSVTYELRIFWRQTEVSESYTGTADLTLSSFLNLTSEPSPSARYKMPVVSFVGNGPNNFIEMELGEIPYQARFALADGKKRAQSSLAASPVLEAPRRR